MLVIHLQHWMREKSAVILLLITALLLDERRKKSMKRKIIYVVMVVIVGTCLGTFLFWLINGRSFSNPVVDTCDAIPDDEKFDCHPDRPASEKECLKRGCCYKKTIDVTDEDLIRSSYLGVPSCYFPRNYKGYSFTLLKNDQSIKGKLKREINSGFLKDIQEVNLDITYINNRTLRIKLTDAKDTKRYEPDIPLYHTIEKAITTLYKVSIDLDGLLTVSRRVTDAIVFKTKLSQLVFSDQFLQISTDIASNYLYGLGEHKDSFLRSFNWTRTTLFNQGDLPVPHRNLYGTHPFYLVVEPDGKANGIFLRNTNAMDALLQPTPAVTLRTIGGILDFFIMLGPSPQDVVKEYTDIVGRPFMIPYWSLGFQLCRYGYFSLNKTNETLQRNLDAGVPLDVLWHDIDYMDNYLDFTFNELTFAGLPEWVNDLHRQEMHYVAMISPGLSNTEAPGTYPAYDKGKELDLFLKDISGNYVESKVWNANYSVYPDFTHPKTAQYWLDNFKEFHKKLKFDGVWLDMNEPLNFENGSTTGCPASILEDPQYLPGRPFPLRTLTICMTSKHYSTIHYNEHNLVAFREAVATFNAMLNIRLKRPFLISRATFAGQGHWSGHWSGDITSDWQDLRYTIPFMLAFNLYGMPMVGSDICGFRQNTTDELCARWQALGAFYPFSRNHNDYDTIEQDPAAMGGNVLEATKNTLRTRYYLLPYFYYLFYRSHVFGESVIRPLFFEYPTDKTALHIDEEFLWGPALLIIPALYPDVVEVKGYFPSDVWYDFFTGERINSSGEYKTLKCDLTSINIAVRGGYILPLQLPGPTTAASRANHFDVLIALNAYQEASGEMYWDDGDSLDTFNKGLYNLNKFSANNNSFNNTIVHHGFPSKMNLNEIKVYGIGQKIKNVTINAQEVGFKYEKNYLLITAQDFSLKEQLLVSWY